MRDFMVQEGINESPEIAQFDAAVAAQKQLMKSKWNVYWSPTIALQGNMSRKMWEDGKGADGGLTIPGASALPEADDNSGNIGLNLSFPVFSGGSKSAVAVTGYRYLHIAMIRLQGLQTAAIATVAADMARS